MMDLIRDIYVCEHDGIPPSTKDMARNTSQEITYYGTNIELSLYTRE